MNVYLFETENQLAIAAAKLATERIQQCIDKKNRACLVAAAGRTQIAFLKELTAFPGIDWRKITIFHLDEYIGLGKEHTASFRKYLKERLVDIVHPGEIHFINGDSVNAETECHRLNKLISQYVVDLTFIGIGVNGHIAFNDPPADLLTKDPYIVVELDDLNKKNQFKKGYFPSVDNVPQKAITMSIKQIMKSKEIFCLVSGESKSRILAESLLGEVTPKCPASVLQKKSKVYMFLDLKAAKLLPNNFCKQYSQFHLDP